MDFAIPRLSLQPLIENIFIHAVAASFGVISIGLSIGRRGRMLTVELWNDTADDVPSSPGHGRGLAFVSSRIRDAGGRMVVTPSEDRFTVRLTIPIRKPASYSMNMPVLQRA
jgi:LytS/YehU family sensor histidine kinase